MKTGPSQFPGEGTVGLGRVRGKGVEGVRLSIPGDFVWMTGSESENSVRT